MPFPVKDITQKWGRPSFSVPAPEERFEKYAGQVPNFLLDLWRELGFAGFRKGLMWLCDPEEWQTTVDEWTAGVDLPFGDDKWVAVTRSAFGRMTLWGQRTGLSLTVIPYSGWLLPMDMTSDMSDDFGRDVQIFTSLRAASGDLLDPDGDDDKPLFKRVLKRLGPVGPDTMYGFVPAQALGGPMLPDHVQIVDATVHMQLLSQITPRTTMINPY
ncbi:GAD-like domain-containing protein [Nocardia sp. NPDC052316]|uniref:GAD-like domain-containing protein n=1 Tax=Nocardia sp. NPDC052316 TaxID=3364329 RepID=UPI0037C8ACCC